MIDNIRKARCPRCGAVFEPFKSEFSIAEDIIDCPICLRGYMKENDGTWRCEPDRILEILEQWS